MSLRRLLGHHMYPVWHGYNVASSQQRSGTVLLEWGKVVILQQGSLQFTSVWWRWKPLSLVNPQTVPRRLYGIEVQRVVAPWKMGNFVLVLLLPHVRAHVIGKYISNWGFGLRSQLEQVTFTAGHAQLDEICYWSSLNCLLRLACPCFVIFSSCPRPSWGRWRMKMKNEKLLYVELLYIINCQIGASEAGCCINVCAIPRMNIKSGILSASIIWCT